MYELIGLGSISLQPTKTRAELDSSTVGKNILRVSPVKLGIALYPRAGCF